MQKLILLFIFTIYFIVPHLCLAQQGTWKYYKRDELKGIVADMTQDKYGNYWFAINSDFGIGEGIVSMLDTCQRWHYLHDSPEWDTTMSFMKRIVVDRENNKWFVGRGEKNSLLEYVVKYDDSTFTYYNPSGNEDESIIHSLGIDGEGQIWAGSIANWAYWFDGIEWHPFFVPGTFIYDPVHVFAADKKGKLYIGHENGISTLDGWIWGGLM